jgi:hypothetical protein
MSIPDKFGGLGLGVETGRSQHLAPQDHYHLKYHKVMNYNYGSRQDSTGISQDSSQNRLFFGLGGAPGGPPGGPPGGAPPFSKA